LRCKIDKNPILCEIKKQGPIKVEGSLEEVKVKTSSQYKKIKTIVLKKTSYVN
jgi:hypothetical protein